jgi:hypothetical protein
MGVFAKGTNLRSSFDDGVMDVDRLRVRVTSMAVVALRLKHTVLSTHRLPVIGIQYCILPMCHASVLLRPESRPVFTPTEISARLSRYHQTQYRHAEWRSKSGKGCLHAARLPP